MVAHMACLDLPLAPLGPHGPPSCLWNMPSVPRRASLSLSQPGSPFPQIPIQVPPGFLTPVGLGSSIIQVRCSDLIRVCMLFDGCF